MPVSAVRPAIPSLGVRRFVSIAAVLLAMAVPGLARAEADSTSPRAVVAAFQDVLLGNMKQAETLGFAGRYRNLLPVLDGAFDIEQMARVIIGGRWGKLGPAEQAQLVELFRQFSVSTYASEFSGYGGEQFAITGERLQPGLGTIVETQIRQQKGESFALNYLLHETPAGWQIIDIHLDGNISELARRRDEFASIIRKDGIAGLLAILKRKSEELARG